MRPSNAYGNACRRDSSILQCTIHHLHNWHTSRSCQPRFSLYTPCSLLCVLPHTSPGAQTMIEIRPPRVSEAKHIEYSLNVVTESSACRYTRFALFSSLFFNTSSSSSPFEPHSPNSNLSSHVPFGNFYLKWS